MKILLTLMALIFSQTGRAQTDTTQISKIDSAIYYHPEIKAEFPGGLNAWVRFLVKNLKYPVKAMKKEVQGTVVTQFIVDSTGASHHVTAIDGPEELREESVRVVEKVKVWVPAVSNGRKVNSWKTQPISFKLQEVR